MRARTHTRTHAHTHTRMHARERQLFNIYIIVRVPTQNGYVARLPLVSLHAHWIGRYVSVSQAHWSDFIAVLEHALEYDIVELHRTQKQVDCSDCDTSTKSGTHVLWHVLRQGGPQRNLPFKGTWHHIKNGRNEIQKYITLGVSSLLIKTFVVWFKMLDYGFGTRGMD